MHRSEKREVPEGWQVEAGSLEEVAFGLASAHCWVSLVVTGSSEMSWRPQPGFTF